MSKNNKRSRGWAFTVSKPTDEQIIHFEQPPFDGVVKWGVFALERGDLNEGLHIQGAIQFVNAKTWTAVRKLLELKPGDELAEFKASQATNAAYCQKGRQSKEEWNEFGVEGENYGLDVDILKIIGEPPKPGEAKVNQWDDIRQAIENGWSDMDIVAKWPQEGIRCQSAIAKYRLLFDRANADWRDVKVYYIHGETGTGKTSSICRHFGYPNVYRVTNYNSGAFDMYDGQDVILYEEFRSSFKLEQMLNYLDGHPVEIPCRYANKLLKATKIFIVTNIPLCEQYRSFHDPYASEGKRRSWDAFNRRIEAEVELKDGQDNDFIMSQLFDILSDS